MKDRAKLKQSVSRLVYILFPELEKLVSSLHTASVYTLLTEFPGAKQIAAAHLTRLKTLLADASRGRYGRDMAVEIRELDAKIKEIETAIQTIMDDLHSPITTIPGIGCRMGAMILAEGKHYNVALSHTAKKLVRLIFRPQAA